MKYRDTLEEVLLKWLGGLSLKERYFTFYEEIEL